MRILITGGCGFLGTNLYNRLKVNGYYVKTLDIKPEADYRFDISKYKNFNQINEKFDIIYHLAAQSGSHRSLLEPELDLEWNAKGTLNICTYAKKTKVKKIIYTSTMAVYGEGNWIKESNPLNPLSNYGISKLYGENCIKQFSQFGIDYTIFRVFNTYGPHQNLNNDKQGVVAVFLSQIINNINPIKVTGSLQRYRDLTYIEDNIDALLLGLKKETSLETYNICSKVKITIKEIIETLIKVSGKNRENIIIKNIGNHDGDQFACTGDNEKLKTLGWNPNYDFEKGLKLFYEYGKKVLNNNIK
jgi:UDP-glucose 4-epimerase